MHKLEIDLDACGFGTVKLDGKDLACNGININVRAGELTNVEISLLIDDLKVRLNPSILKVDLTPTGPITVEVHSNG
jgi:hypothetical protein